MKHDDRQLKQRPCSTRVDAGSYLQLRVWFMRDLEVVADVDQVKSHAGYLPSVIDAIFFRDT